MLAAWLFTSTGSIASASMRPGTWCATICFPFSQRYLGEVAVMRAWGRMSKRGGEKTEVFATEHEAATYFLELARRKRVKGYRPVGTCGNGGIGQLSNDPTR
jgi:predicted DNA-binding WGR domain protein